MHIILYGPEGSGKSTQGKLVAKDFNLVYLASGDLVRDAAATDKGMIGDVCREVLKEGKYVPDSEMFVLWKKRLKAKDINGGWVMDGFPRNVTQSRFLDKKLAKYKESVDGVIYLKVREKIAVERLLKRGRKLGNGELHDSPARIRERLRRYHEGEKDVLAFYKGKKLLIEVDGERDIEVVHHEIMKKLKKLCKIS